MTENWITWAGAVAFAVERQMWAMAQHLLDMALAYVLAVLESLGIHYGPRLAAS